MSNSTRSVRAILFITGVLVVPTGALVLGPIAGIFSLIWWANAGDPQIITVGTHGDFFTPGAQAAGHLCFMIWGGVAVAGLLAAIAFWGLGLSLPRRKKD